MKNVFKSKKVLASLSGLFFVSTVAFGAIAGAANGTPPNGNVDATFHSVKINDGSSDTLIIEGNTIKGGDSGGMTGPINIDSDEGMKINSMLTFGPLDGGHNASFDANGFINAVHMMLSDYLDIGGYIKNGDSGEPVRINDAEGFEVSNGSDTVFRIDGTDGDISNPSTNWYNGNHPVIIHDNLSVIEGVNVSGPLTLSSFDGIHVLNHLPFINGFNNNHVLDIDDDGVISSPNDNVVNINGGLHVSGTITGNYEMFTAEGSQYSVYPNYNKSLLINCPSGYKVTGCGFHASKWKVYAPHIGVNGDYQCQVNLHNDDTSTANVYAIARCLKYE